MKSLPFLVALAATASFGLAQNILVVPSQYPTVQAAIAAAATNDTVLVAPGTYQENIDVLGKDISIRSIGGAAVTTLDGSLVQTSTVLFSPGSTRAAVLEGFTITGGALLGNTADKVGGGIRINGSSPTIRFCVVRGNSAGAYGGGIGASDYPGATLTSPLIEDCIIEDNSAAGTTAFASGGGIAIGGFGTTAPVSGAEIRRCVIRRNTANTRGGGIILLYNASITIDSNEIYQNNTLGASGSLDGGAGIWFSLGAVPTITNNRIHSNASASNGGGIKYFNSTGANVVNNTIVGNIGGGVAAFANVGAFGINVSANFVNNIIYGNGTGPEFAFSGSDQASQPPSANVSYCVVTGGYPGTGNIATDPQLLNPRSGNHRLSSTSPCRDAGNNAAAGLPAADFEGDNRVFGPAVDIGADEYVAGKVLHWADRFDVSMAAPANVTYSVDGGSARAGHTFAIFFGLSGTNPGVNIVGLHLPLNIDLLTTSLPPLAGALNLNGVGTGVLPLSQVSFGPALIGLRLSSAAAIIAPGMILSAFTNDENISFVQ